jgi:energy-coupling factor transporter ATP-binding protein EcfA2
MGLCSSTANPEDKVERQLDRRIDEGQKRTEAAEGKINKLLLLGAGASGKSTLFKQMITIYGKGFPESERKTYTNIIFNNILTSIRVLIKQAPKYGEIQPGLNESKRILEAEMKEDQAVTEELAVHLKYIW